MCYLPVDICSERNLDFLEKSMQFFVSEVSGNLLICNQASIFFSSTFPKLSKSFKHLWNIGKVESSEED